MPTISEIFGYPPDDQSSAAIEARMSRTCSIINQPCSKHFNDRVVSGVCTLQNRNEHIPTCPIRLYADGYLALRNVATHCFGTNYEMVSALDFASGHFENGAVIAFGKGWGGELRLPSLPGTRGGYFVDWILALVNRSGDLQEFVAVEVQTIDTTGSYRSQFENIINGQDKVPNEKCGFNWENVNKRILPQLIYKGHVLHRESLCRRGLFFISPLQVQDRIFRRLGGRDQIEQFPQNPGAITFWPYIVSPHAVETGKHRPLLLSEADIFTTEVRQIEIAFSGARNFPPPGVYAQAIRAALSREGGN